MRRSLKNKKVAMINSAKKSYLFIFLVLTLYFFNLLSSTKSNGGNIYDLLLKLTEFHPLFYFILPAFLIILMSLFSLGNVQNYLLIRFGTKRKWYHANLLWMAKTVTYFCLLLVAIMLLQSVFVLDFNNQWSNYSLNYYTYHTELLTKISPIFLTTMSVILLWLFLFFHGIFFYISYLLSGRLLFSIMIVFVFNILSIGVVLSHINQISTYLFYKHINIFQYTYDFSPVVGDYPFEIILYWVGLIFLFYVIGFFLIDKKDMYVGERK
ncbi:hypothetical protein [Sporosarcina sp. FSL K6-5500]|uniref:hypothetical protein n=1 Tax=Sporosarcina sp. FSL K6-5500 TaxID=2921558 RepID=UPI0030F71730